MIKVTHNFGFFSCCSMRLDKIVKYINSNKLFPRVDSSKQFLWYKQDSCKSDITIEYFKKYDEICEEICEEICDGTIEYEQKYQYFDYSTLDYKMLKPIMKKYFSPSDNIKEIISNIENKYELDYKNTCVLFYRGNDKRRETTICEYNEYLKYASSVIAINPATNFLIQSDETEFIEYMLEKFPNNSFYFKDYIRHMKRTNSTVDIVMKDKNFEYSQYYLGITIIMSKCKYIICGSGNCSMWIMFYRGNNNNVYQNTNKKWIEPKKKTYVMKYKDWLKYKIDIDDIIYNASLDSHDKNTLKLPDDGFIPEPIGVSHSLTKEDLKIINENMNDEVINSNMMYYAWRPNDERRRKGSQVTRRIIRSTLEKKGYKSGDGEGKNYLTKVCKARFAPSPEGNGIDCHRHWEALYCKSIPIIEHNPQIKTKLVNLPVIYTTDYSEINDEYLDMMYKKILEETFDFSALFLSTYSDDLQKKIVKRSNYWSRLRKKEIYYD